MTGLRFKVGLCLLYLITGQLICDDNFDCYEEFTQAISYDLYKPTVLDGEVIEGIPVQIIEVTGTIESEIPQFILGDLKVVNSWNYLHGGTKKESETLKGSVPDLTKFKIGIDTTDETITHSVVCLGEIRLPTMLFGKTSQLWRSRIITGMVKMTDVLGNIQNQGALWTLVGSMWGPNTIQLRQVVLDQEKKRICVMTTYGCEEKPFFAQSTQGMLIIQEFPGEHWNARTVQFLKQEDKSEYQMAFPLLMNKASWQQKIKKNYPRCRYQIESSAKGLLLKVEQECICEWSHGDQVELLRIQTQMLFGNVKGYLRCSKDVKIELKEQVIKVPEHNVIIKEEMQEDNSLPWWAIVLITIASVVVAFMICCMCSMDALRPRF